MTRTPHNPSSLQLASNPYGLTSSTELDSFAYNNNSNNNSGGNSVDLVVVGTTTINNSNIGVGGRVVGVAAQQQMAAQSGANNSARHMSKVLAHSTSLLANDSYIAGMSSDSELTSASTNRHHHRPYSSQSRVYHAHPAPRSSHASSRVSHYSDSAATYVPNKPPPSASSAISMQVTSHIQQQQQQQANQARHNLQHHIPQQQHLSHQGSISSSGSGGSAAYLGLADSPVSPMLQQQQRPVASGRQLPHRPFKQSVSIDHHSSGQYHHHQSPHQVGHLTSSPVQASTSLGPRFEPSIYQQHQQQSYPVGLIGAVGQRQLVSAPHSEPRYVGGSGASAAATTTTGQRDFRFEMDLMEKQAENINLYDENSASAMAPASSAPSVGLSPATKRPTSSSRQLPPTSNQAPTSNIGSMSVEHLHHQMDHQYHPSAAELQQQQQQHQKQFHHKQELYASHQMTSSPADWLPPIGFTGQSHQHGARSSSGGAGGATSQFKQTVSIDHYTNANQHHHYSPARAPNFAEHYRGPLGYASSSPVGGYESPTHHHLHHQQQQQQHLAYQSPSGDVLYHHGSTLSQQDQQQQSQQGPFALSASQLANAGRNSSQDSSTTIRDPSSVQCAPTNFIHHQSPARGANKSSGCQQPKPNLQHQISSSSSNSQSGSLKSNNMDANKNSLVDHQKASSTTLSQFQQQQHHQQQPSPHHHKGSYDYQIQQQPRQHGVLRKGYTSAVTGLTNSNTALNEFTDLAQTPPGGPHGIGGVYLGSYAGDKRSGLRAASPSVAIEAAASSSSGIQQQQSGPSKADCGTRSESSTGLPNGASSNSSSLTKKSNSATQLSMTGTKKRLGFRKKQVTSFSVHRSEEVAPLEARHLVKQGSSVSEGDSSMSGDSSSRSWSNSNFKQQTSDELASMSFIDGLGKGQMISRQGLASPYLGDIQLSLCDRRGNLEIEVIRARNLQAKTNKILPLTYVKLYLVKNRKCLAKAKTTLSNKRTLDPLFQQQLTFHEDYHGCILQSIIWGNFGKMDKKNFMGIAQISIDDLELSDTVISWYKLFLPSSLQTLPSKSLRHTLLSNSTESFTNTNNS